MSPPTTRGGVRAVMASLAAAIALACVPAAASAQEPDASITLGDPNQERGLVQIDEGDGRTAPVNVAGRSARTMVVGGNPAWARHMYFRVDDAIAHDGAYAACLRVEFLQPAVRLDGERLRVGGRRPAHEHRHVEDGRLRPAGRRALRGPRERGQRLPAGHGER
jgi:hypothetical protein